MTKYSIIISPKVEKDIACLDRRYQLKLLKLIESLGENPRPVGCKKLVGSIFWRVRVGLFRVVYSIADDILIVEIIRVAHRKEAFK